MTLRNHRYLKPTLTVNNPPCPDIQPDNHPNNTQNTQNPPSLPKPDNINENNLPDNADMPNLNLVSPNNDSHIIAPSEPNFNPPIPRALKCLSSFNKPSLKE